MTESIAIPRRKGKQRLLVTSMDSSPSMSADSSPMSSTASSANGTSPSEMPATEYEAKKTLSAREKGKMPAKEGIESPPRYGHERRTSLLSSSISRSEHTVINIGDDERPRLITCVKASQGFDWNQDIFLPSYMSDRDYQNDLERRQDPVEDIFITEEEAEMMFPS